MALPRITQTVQAAQDMDDIWSRIAENNLPAADAMLDAIEVRCQMLARQPLIGRARPELAPGVRSFPIGRYVLFYCPLAQGIQVVRVLHGACDIGQVFQDE